MSTRGQPGVSKPASRKLTVRPLTFGMRRARTPAGLLVKLGAARSKARAAWRLIDVEVAEHDATFTFSLNRDKLRKARRREGRYLLRTNLCDEDPAKLWKFCVQLVEIEAAFKNLKDDLQLRPIYYQLEHRIQAHILVAFLAYCLHVTLRAKLKPLAPGLTPRAVFDKARRRARRCALQYGP
jgi:hypothetical protein